jgi:uncharacterized membrane protein (UPF0127 family)
MTASNIPTDLRSTPVLAARGRLPALAVILRCYAVATVTVALLIAAALGHVRADQAMRVELVVIETDTGTHQFNTEVADTPTLRERGLMFRHELAGDRAMLFDWGRELVATMWMRNTYVPLDMIFIASDGRVAGIAENTVPQSLETISSGVPVAAVLEVAAGTARRIRLKPGDRVIHRIFKAE